MRASLIVAIAALSVMAFGASAAKAAPFTTEFDDAALKIPGFDAFDILGAPDQATLTGDITAGAVTVPSANFVFPLFSTGPPEFPIALTVDLNAAAPITGTVDGVTGQAVMASSSYQAVVTLSGGPNCVYTLDMALSTAPPGGGEPAHPIPGDPFVVDTSPGALAAGPPPVLGSGVLAEGWNDIPLAPDPTPGPPNECTTLNGLVSGGDEPTPAPGGLAMGQGVDITPEVAEPPPTPPQPPVTTPKKKKKKCKKAKKKGKGASAAAKCKKKKKKK